jgi:copper chaperone
MSTYKFKTSINCQSCVNIVKAYMNEVPNLSGWEVATTNPDKVLTVNGDGLSANEVIVKVQEAGFTIEQID